MPLIGAAVGDTKRAGVPASDNECVLLLVAPSPSHAATAFKLTSFETPSKEPEKPELLPKHHLPKHGTPAFQKWWVETNSRFQDN